jgi:hypothetical protein
VEHDKCRGSEDLYIWFDLLALTSKDPQYGVIICLATDGVSLFTGHDSGLFIHRELSNGDFLLVKTSESCFILILLYLAGPQSVHSMIQYKNIVFIGGIDFFIVYDIPSRAFVSTIRGKTLVSFTPF